MTRPCHDDVAKRFAKARAAAIGFGDYPDSLPADLVEAYAVQQAAIEAWNRPIAGWKIGRITGAFAAVENRFVGPIFADSVSSVSAQIASFPIIPGGFAALEAELIAVINGPVCPDAGRWTRENCIPTIKRWHVGIEIAGSPLATINDLGPLVSIAGFGNNMGLLLGPHVELADPDAAQCTVDMGDNSFGPARAGSLPGGPLAAVAFALNKLVELGHPIPDGTLLSTGALTGVHEVGLDQYCRATFEPGGVIVCKTETAHREG